MQYLILNNNVEMPILGFGTYTIIGNGAKNCILNAIECGYRLIDTAKWYKNEHIVGEAISASKINRKEFFITTKLQSGINVANSIEESLNKLQTDYIDLLLIHWVMGNDLEIYKIMENYYKKGKLRAIGLSNFYDKNYFNILENSEIKPQVIQQEVNILCQNKKWYEQYKKDSIQLMAWSPFGAGKENIFNHPILLDIGRKYAKTTAQIILRFLVHNNIVSIPKTSNLDRMKENINIFDFELSNSDIQIIKNLDRNKSLFGWY